ncbi:MAG: CcmD family protein [Cyclobacteriaceae bacterium]|nr:CcmD family protein [Cyclobacteriaceae bacterium]
MKNWSARFLTTALLVCSSLSTWAQEVEMADTLRAEGKIYVIVGIILIVLAGLFVYLFLLDRKVSRIEKSLNK